MENVERLKVSRGVPFILSNIFLERFSTLGVSGEEISLLDDIKKLTYFVVAILVLYLNRKLNFEPSTSIAIFHANQLLTYSFTIIGAIIADSWLGIYKTILWMILLYVVGGVVTTLGSIEALDLSTL